MAFEFSDTTKARIFQRQGGVCAHCGNPGIADYHHIVPRQSGDPTNMSHGWLATEKNGVGLCSFDHKAVHIGDDPQFKIRYQTGAIPPASYFEFAFGKGDKADPQAWRTWEADHARLARPIWDDLQRKTAAAESDAAAKLLGGNMSPPVTPGAPGERANVDLAKRRARLRSRSGGFVDLGLRGGKGIDKGKAASAALLIGMIIGAALKYALNCQNEDQQSNDLNQWEQWIRRQQMNDPSSGCLLAVQYSILTMGPADPMVKYVLTANYVANTPAKALELMRKDPPDNALARSGEYDPAQLTYPEPMLHWYAPLTPFADDVANQKLRAVMAAMEPPSDDREAFHILDGASMADLLVIYAAIFKNPGYSPLWRSIDRASITNKSRLTAAAKAVRDNEASQSFSNYISSLPFPMFDKDSDDYKTLADYFGLSNQAATLPNWVRGWWTAYDGNYYYYYFQDTPSVMYTKTKPAGGSASPPASPANRGKVVMTERGLKITWNPNGAGGPTVETFTQLNWSSTTEMNGVSNKYSPLFARKIP